MPKSYSWLTNQPPSTGHSSITVVKSRNVARYKTRKLLPKKQKSCLKVARNTKSFDKKFQKWLILIRFCTCFDDFLQVRRNFFQISLTNINNNKSFNKIIWQVLIVFLNAFESFWRYCAIHQSLFTLSYHYSTNHDVCIKCISQNNMKLMIFIINKLNNSIKDFTARSGLPKSADYSVQKMSWRFKTVSKNCLNIE